MQTDRFERGRTNAGLQNPRRQMKSRNKGTARGDAGGKELDLFRGKHVSRNTGATVPRTARTRQRRSRGGVPHVDIQRGLSNGNLVSRSLPPVRLGKDETAGGREFSLPRLLEETVL